MAEAGNAEFKGKANFGSLVRGARAVAKALKKVEDARKAASGPIEFTVDEASLRKAEKRVRDAFDDVEVPVEPDVDGFEEKVNRKTRRTRPDPVDVPVEPDVDPFERGLRKAVADAERKRYEVKITTSVDQSGLDQGLRRLQVQTASGKYTIEVPVELTGEDLAVEVRRQVERAEREQVDVPVEADTSPFEKGMRAALGKKRGPVEVDVDANTTPFDRAMAAAVSKAERETVTIKTDIDQTGVNEGLRRIEVATRSGKYTMTVPVELSGRSLAAEASRLVREAEARSGSVDIPVEADGSGLRRQVGVLARLAGAGQKIKIQVEADDSALNRLRASMGGVVNVGGLLSGVLGLLKWPAIIAGAQLAAGALSALAAAGVGAVSALGPLAGLLGTLPALGAAVGGIFASVKLAFMGMGDALKAYGKSQSSAGKSASQAAEQERAAAKARVAAARGVQRAQQAVADAQKRAADLQVAALRRVQSAERSLASAQKTAQRAQLDLNRARKEAARQLADLRKEINRGALDEERATLGVEEARARLSEVMADSTSTDLEKRAAILDLKEAEASLADVQQKRLDDAAALADAEQKGIEGADQVVDAKERVAEAEVGILDAQQELADAQAGISEAQLEGARMVADAQQGLVEALEAVREAAIKTGDAGASAMDPFAEAMAKLPPSAQQFVRFLLGLQPLLDKLKATAADNMLPGLEVGIRNAVTLFPLANKFVGMFSKAVGDAAAEVSTLAFEPGFVADLDSIGNQGVNAVRTLASAFKPLLRSLVGVGAAAAPLTEFVSSYVAELVGLVSASLDAGRASGAMARFFDETRFVFKAVMDTLVNLTKGLIRVGAIAYDVIGRDLVEMLRDAGQAFANFTGSVEGKNKIREFFEDAKPAIMETIALIGDLVSMFFRLSGSTDLAPLIKQIRTEFLPVLEKLLSGDTSKFTKGLIDLATQVAKVFTSLGGAGGPLVIFVETLARMAEALAFLSENVPGFNQLVGALAILIGVSKGVSFVGWITGGSKLVEIFSKKNAEGVSLFSKALSKIGPAASKMSSIVVTAFTAMGKGIAAAGAWMLANPIVLAIVAVIAVIALLIWKWDAVKEFLGKVWHWLYDKAYEIFPAIAAVIVSGVDWIKEKWGGLVDWFGGLWDSIKSKAGDLASPFRDAWDSAWDAVVNSPIAQKVGDVVGKTLDVVKKIWGITPLGFIQQNWSAVWGGLTTAVETVWPIISGIVAAGVGFVTDTIGTMLDVMLPVWEAVWNGLLTVVDVVFDAVVSAVETGILTVLAVIEAALDTIIFLWDNAWNLVTTIASAAWAAIVSGIEAVVAVLSPIWTTLTSLLTTAWTVAWNVISTTLQAAWSRISSIVGTLASWLIGTWQWLGGILSSVWTTAWNTISSIASTMMGRIRSVITGGLNTIQSVWNSVWNGLAWALGGAWNTIRSVAAAGVNGVIAILNTLIKGANAVLSKLPGGVKIGEITYRAQFAEGGRAQDGIVPGVGNRDTVKALLTPDEFVVKQRSARKVGYDALAYINEHGELPPDRRRRYARGGKVTPISSAPSYVPRYAKGGKVMNPLDIIPNAVGDLVTSGVNRVISTLALTARSQIRNVPGADSIPGRVFVGVGSQIIDGVVRGASKLADAAGTAAKYLTPGGAASALIGALPFFHSGGGVGFDPNREVLALLQRGEGVMSGQAMSNVSTALGEPDMSAGTTVVNNNTSVSVEVNNPVGEPTEESLHRSLQKLAAHGILPTTEAA